MCRYVVYFLKEHGKEVFIEVRSAYIDTMNKVNAIESTVNIGITCGPLWVLFFLMKYILLLLIKKKQILELSLPGLHYQIHFFNVHEKWKGVVYLSHLYGYFKYHSKVFPLISFFS